MIQKSSYILQAEGSYCFLVSMLNAKRYHGLPTCKPGDREFEWLVDFSFARNGSCLRRDELCERLGVRLVEVSMEEAHLNLPVSFACWPPGCRSHEVLAIGGNADEWELVNYRIKTGPVVERVKVVDLKIAPKGVHMHRFSKVLLRSDSLD